MDLAVVTLSRWQFAITVISHFIFVPTTIGLFAATLIFELIYAFGKGKDNEHYGRLALFFAKIAFISFGCGVVTGLVMEMQFGMNWSVFAAFFGDVAGVSITLETLTAFFLEATLMGLWRFTWGKINKRTHALIGALLLVTALLSIFWIISVNAFMQNPVGYTMEGGQARLDSILSLLQNPQYLPQVLHVFFGIMILGGFVTAGVSAWQILKKRSVELFKKSVQIGLLVAVPFAIMQPLMGDDQIYATVGLQPMKFLAAEAVYEDEGSDTEGAPWAALAWADEEAREAARIDIPVLGSYFANGTFVGASPGMNSVSEIYHEQYDDLMAPNYGDNIDYYPPVNLMFTLFRWMIYVGYYFIIFGTMAIILLNQRKKPIEQHPNTLKALGITMWFPYITLIAGWVVAEVGRYPFVVYGLVTQAEAVSANMTLPKIIFSLCVFAVLDLTLVIVTVTLAHRVVKKGAPSIHDTYPTAPAGTDFFGKEAEANV